MATAPPMPTSKCTTLCLGEAPEVTAAQNESRQTRFGAVDVRLPDQQPRPPHHFPQPKQKAKARGCMATATSSSARPSSSKRTKRVLRFSDAGPEHREARAKVEALHNEWQAVLVRRQDEEPVF